VLTADWEEQLKQVERGALAATGFMNGIIAMTGELVQTYEPEARAAFPPTGKR
jgi:DNA topoisomerase IA